MRKSIFPCLFFLFCYHFDIWYFTTITNTMMFDKASIYISIFVSFLCARNFTKKNKINGKMKNFGSTKIQSIDRSSFMRNAFLPRSFAKMEAAVPASFLFCGEERRSLFRSFFRSISRPRVLGFTFCD